MSAAHMNDSMDWANIMQWKKEDVPPWGVVLKENYESAKHTCHPHMPEVELNAYNFVSEIDWTVTRLLKLISTSMETGPWIAGGASLKWYQGQGVGSGDIDIWCRDQIQFERVHNLLSNEYSRFFTLSYQTDNAISFEYNVPQEDQNLLKNLLYNNPTHMNPNVRTFYKIQLICRKFFSKPQDIIDCFDFTICQVVTDGVSVVVGKRTHYDIKHKILRFAGEVNPKAALRRFTKYLCKGYRPVDGMVSQILALPDIAFENWGGSDPYDI